MDDKQKPKRVLPQKRAWASNKQTSTESRDKRNALFKLIVQTYRLHSAISSYCGRILRNARTLIRRAGIARRTGRRSTRITLRIRVGRVHHHNFVCRIRINNPWRRRSQCSIRIYNGAFAYWFNVCVSIKQRATTPGARNTRTVSGKTTGSALTTDKNRGSK